MIPDVRGKTEIIGDIIRHTLESLIITHIMHKANLCYGQLKRYLPYCIESGLVEISGEGYRATDKGRQYLSYYDALKELTA